MAAGQQSFADHLGESEHLLEQVGERLGRLHEASQKIEKLAGDVTRLEDLLKPPKLRGTLGEMFLEQALAPGPAAGAPCNPASAWRRLVVDAVVLIKDRLVPSTASSRWRTSGGRARPRTRPSGAGRGSSSAATSASTPTRSPKVHPAGRGDLDFALMYVPAEAVYAEIVADGERRRSRTTPSTRRVFPVSPRLLYAYLSRSRWDCGA